jgi:hypothetical protein
MNITPRRKLFRSSNREKLNGQDVLQLGKGRASLQNFGGESWGRNQFEELGVEGNIILKWTLKYSVGRDRTGLICLKMWKIYGLM